MLPIYQLLHRWFSCDFDSALLLVLEEMNLLCSVFFCIWYSDGVDSAAENSSYLLPNLNAVVAISKAMQIAQVAQLSQRDRATHELLRFAKLRSGIFEPPFWGA